MKRALFTQHSDLPFLVELPGIEPELLPGKMHSDLPVRSRSLPAVSSRVLTASRAVTYPIDLVNHSGHQPSPGLNFYAQLVLAVIPKAPLPKAWSDLEPGFESFEADGDAFGLGVFMDGFSAVLATDSAHLVAAERNLGLIPIRVDKNVARFQGVGDFCAFPNIVRPDVAREPIVGIVRHRHGISELTVRHYAEDRTEQFVARHRHLRRHVREYGRRQEIPFLEALLSDLVSTAVGCRAIGPRFVDFFEDFG